jgi:hypothetical protein
VTPRAGDLPRHTTDSLSASGNIEFHLNARLDGLKAVTLTGKRYVVQETFNWEFTISKAAEDALLRPLGHLSTLSH